MNRVDTVIIGNGPSGISLSYLLSGWTPYLEDGSQCGDELLQMKLDYVGGGNLLEKDFDILTSGLEGRSSNPVALLYDMLAKPQADLNIKEDTLLNWRLDETKAVDHVVLGKGQPGGSWQFMPEKMETLSSAAWLELPDLPFNTWMAGKSFADLNILSNQSTGSHPTASLVQEYYNDYVFEKNIAKNFISDFMVTSVTRCPCEIECCQLDEESGEDTHPGSHSSHEWEVTGCQIVHDNGEILCVQELSWRADHVVLACGIFDAPNEFKIPGKSLPLVRHARDITLDQALSEKAITGSSDQIVVVGAGLTAADAIFDALSAGVQVLHVFRKSSHDPSIIYSKLPAPVYPQYHALLRMMRGEETHTHYTPLEEHELAEVLADNKVIVSSAEGNKILIETSLVYACIGSQCNLSFMPSNCTNVGCTPGIPINCRTNPVSIDPLTHESIEQPSLYALGPLVGDNFIRFVQGGALAAGKHLISKPRVRKPLKPDTVAA